jgi:hypothetical protein
MGILAPPSQGIACLLVWAWGPADVVTLLVGMFWYCRVLTYTNVFRWEECSYVKTTLVRRVWCVLCLRNSEINTFLIAYFVLLGMPIVAPITFMFAFFLLRLDARERSVLKCERKSGNFVTTYYVRIRVGYKTLYNVFCGRSACGCALLE